MPPEVLAWALLFVVGFAIAYRFIAWIGRFARQQRPRREGAVPVATAIALSPATAPAAPAPKVAVAPTAGKVPPVASATAAPLVTAPAEAESARKAIPDLPAAPPSASSPAAPRFVPPPPLPLAASAVMSKRIAGEAVRMALAPSIAATLPPRPKPSVAATLPPPTIQAPERTPEPAPADTIFAALARAPRIPDGVAPDHQSAESAPAARETSGATNPTRSIRLLARRIGHEAIRLDIRLRDSRERRIVPMPKTLRRPSLAANDKGLKVLLPKAATEKGPRAGLASSRSARSSSPRRRRGTGSSVPPHGLTVC